MFTGRYDHDGNPLFYNKWRDLTWYMGIGHKVLLPVVIVLGGIALIGLVGAAYENITGQ